MLCHLRATAMLGPVHRLRPRSRSVMMGRSSNIISQLKKLSCFRRSCHHGLVVSLGRGDALSTFRPSAFPSIFIGFFRRVTRRRMRRPRVFFFLFGHRSWLRRVVPSHSLAGRKGGGLLIVVGAVHTCLSLDTFWSGC
jgi:hypothetical protein